MRVGFVLLVIVPFSTLALIARMGAHPLDNRAGELDRIFTASAALAILPIAMLFWLRATHQRRGNLSVAIGLAGLALFGLGVGELIPLIAAGDSAVEWGSERTLTLLLVFLFLAPATKLDVRINWSPVVILTSLLALIALMALRLEVIGSDASPILIVGWALLTAALAASYLRTTETTYLWLAIILLGFLMSELGRHAPAGSDGVWALAVGVTRTTAIMIAVLGLVVDLDHSGSNRRRELEQAQERNATLAGLADASLKAAQERDHKARSALGAMEYMIQALKRRGASIETVELTQLEVSMTSEIALLRRLVTIPEVDPEVGPFSVADAVVGVLNAARERGLDIDVAVPEDLYAIGVQEAAAEIVQNLLENADKHAFGSPVSVRAVRVGPYVIVNVDDQGPGVPKAQHSQIFQRGRDGGHSTSAQGRGLGLYIAAQLASEMGGHLWVEDAPGGGASFRLALEALQPARFEEMVGSEKLSVPAMPSRPPIARYGQGEEGGGSGRPGIF